MEKTFLSLRECAEKSGVALYWWRKAVRNNAVPYFRSGSKFYIDYAAAVERLRDEARGNAVTPEDRP